MKGNKAKNDKTNELVDKIINQFDGEIVVDGEPVEYRGLLFDSEILDKNLIVYSVRYKGARKIGKNTVNDFIVRADIQDGDTKERVEFLTNHSYIIRIANLLQEFKRPLQVRIVKEKNKYIIKSWL